MTTLYIMRGLPGSGKSTIAYQMMTDANTPTVIVSRDDLRQTYFRADVPGRDAEDLITKAEFSAIRHALKSGFDVISDNTHIRASYVNDKIKLAYEFKDVKVEIVDVDTPIVTCLERNAKRGLVDGGRYVPPEVIHRMNSQYKPYKHTPMPTFEPYVANTSLPKCLLVDVDGTIALNDGHRSYYEWNKVGGDKPIQNVIDLVNAVCNSEDIINVIIFSGRDGVSEQDTLKWLKDSGVHYDEFFMRNEGDMRPDTIVKMEMFDAYIRHHYNCIGVVDDRPAVVRQWLKHDITVFHVDPFGDDF